MNGQVGLLDQNSLVYTEKGRQLELDLDLTWTEVKVLRLFLESFGRNRKRSKAQRVWTLTAGKNIYI